MKGPPLDTTPPVLTDLDDLASGLAAEGVPWDEVARLAGPAGVLLRDHLVGVGLWPRLSRAEQAGVHWAMAQGCMLGGVRREWVGPDHRAGLSELAGIVRYYADRLAGTAWQRNPARQAAADLAADFAERFVRLPEGWRGEVMRRVIAGADPTTTIHQAVGAMNVLHSTFGIDPRQAPTP
jgi:hypothetical protein